MAVKCNDAEFVGGIRELSESKETLSSNLTSSSSTGAPLMNSPVFAHPVGLQGESIGLSGYPSKSLSTAPLSRLNSLLTLNRVPTFSLQTSNYDQKILTQIIALKFLIYHCIVILI